jgi:hypothetical protein
MPSARVQAARAARETAAESASTATISISAHDIASRLPIIVPPSRQSVVRQPLRRNRRQPRSKLGTKSSLEIAGLSCYRYVCPVGQTARASHQPCAGRSFVPWHLETPSMSPRFPREGFHQCPLSHRKMGRVRASQQEAGGSRTEVLHHFPTSVLTKLRCCSPSQPSSKSQLANRSKCRTLCIT